MSSSIDSTAVGSSHCHDLKVLLTAINPRAECCIDTREYGTLRLQGSWKRQGEHSVLQIDLDSFASLHLADDNDAEWRPVRGVPNVTDLKDRLKHLLDESDYNSNAASPSNHHHDTDSEKTDAVAAIQRFVRNCQLVFHELIQSLENPSAPTLNAVAHGTTNLPPGRETKLSDILLLDRQLRTLEAKFPMAIVELSSDLTTLTLCATDDSNRRHEMELQLHSNYVSNGVSNIKTDLPNRTDEDESSEQKNKRQRIHGPTSTETLLGLFLDFSNKIQSYQGLWNELDDLDAHTWILEPIKNRSSCTRNILLTSFSGQQTKFILTLHPKRPRDKPIGVQFLGPIAQDFAAQFSTFQNWDAEKSVRVNLEQCFGTSCVLSKDASTTDDQHQHQQQDDAICAICFSSLLEASKEEKQQPCENPTCGRIYHESCLRKWLESLPTSRTSFDTIIGKCPYCKEPIAAQMPRRY